jgi:hypothetical protein
MERTVDRQPEPGSDTQSEGIDTAKEQFRLALLRSRKAQEYIGEVEVAAARFCQALRRQGQSPERTLIDAKRVIEDAIDGHSQVTAERAVLSCIQHYYRAD